LESVPRFARLVLIASGINKEECVVSKHVVPLYFDIVHRVIHIVCMDIPSIYRKVVEDNNLARPVTVYLGGSAESAVYIDGHGVRVLLSAVSSDGCIQVLDVVPATGYKSE